ncbi:hypothetical protein Tcan_03799 [Toxocara canis]|uniref:Uncharacterized protein n=1 Tax=Toxocara canis TaxID=6265 RepID=A0A0B2VT10_TOXCA|nr:hypothetical protein Tcan_03799 [Toxocara canis]
MGKKNKSPKKAKKKEEAAIENLEHVASTQASNRETNEDGALVIPAEGNCSSEADNIVANEQERKAAKDGHSDESLLCDITGMVAKECDASEGRAKIEQNVCPMVEKEDRSVEITPSENCIERKETVQEEKNNIQEESAMQNAEKLENNEEEEQLTRKVKEENNILGCSIDGNSDQLKQPVVNDDTENEIICECQIIDSSSVEKSSVNSSSDDTEGGTKPKPESVLDKVGLQEGSDSCTVFMAGTSLQETSSASVTCGSEHDRSIGKEPNQEVDAASENINTKDKEDERKKLADTISICSQTTSLADTGSLNSQIVSTTEKTDSETGDEATSREMTPDSTHKEDSDVSSESTLFGRFTRMGDVVMGRGKG